MSKACYFLFRMGWGYEQNSEINRNITITEEGVEQYFGQRVTAALQGKGGGQFSSFLYVT